MKCCCRCWCTGLLSMNYESWSCRLMINFAFEMTTSRSCRAGWISDHCFDTPPSVLWHCWLDVRKSIWPVRNWVMRCWRGYLSVARCKWSAYCLADATATPSYLLRESLDWFNLSGAGLPTLWKIASECQNDWKLTKFFPICHESAGQWWIGMWQSQIKSEFVGFGFCTANPSDLDSDAELSHDLI